MFTFQIYRLTNHPARRAPTGHIAQSRLQTGAYHSHIQVIPRDEDDYSGEDNCKDSVPTFRSPSLQFPSDSSRVPRIPITATDETGKKTFAEMARRFNRNNAVNSEDRPAAGPVSLARLIKVHPNHRKASNKTYRPMRLSDFGEDENDNDAEELFGKNLPDPIELSVKVGEFDGQIMFIGHPNRDISAHQWDMTAYQWVNIGLYSNTRHRIEGSLASDRLRAPSISHNSMEYFKAVADQREAIAQAGPSACEAKSAEQSTVLGLGSPNHANQDDADHFASLSGESRSSREQLPGIDDANKASKAKFTPRTIPIVTRPPSGLTVANPHRIVSTLNATATPYIAPANNQAQRDQKDSESEGTAANGQIMASLKFSDPDGNRQVQAHEIANGLRNEVPTKQNLRGPFFTHHMPTTQHPTTSLSIEMGWEEKLKTWFHDGQRPARQQEFSHTIIAGANTEARTRRMVTFGAIGQLSSHKKSRFETNRYENTSAFVRLYENISVYSEEIRAGKNRDYFTK
ncbi:hypothetical protein B0J11DRAFT_460550, partial [Dendryphion nanum]